MLEEVWERECLEARGFFTPAAAHSGGGGGGYLKAVMYCKKDSVHLPSWTSNS